MKTLTFISLAVVATWVTIAHDSTCPISFMSEVACDAYRILNVTIPVDGTRPDKCGSKYNEDMVNSLPINISFKYTHTSGKYTLMLISDAKTAGKNKIHWLVNNIPGADLQRGITNAKQLPSEIKYLGPTNVDNLRRYHYICYQQTYLTGSNQSMIIKSTNVLQPGLIDLYGYHEMNKLNGPVASFSFIIDKDLKN